MDKSGKPIDISKSSLVSLKAELIRKKEEADKLRGNENYLKLPARPKPEIKANPGVSQRNERDLVEAELSTEEVDLLKKSKDVLAIKASLYEQLQSGALVSEDGESRYLVDFEKKEKLQPSQSAEIGPPPPEQEPTPGPSTEQDYDQEEETEEFEDDDSEWIEYKDCLGRSRKCLRSDLPSMKARDEVLSKKLLKDNPKTEEMVPKTEEEELKELVSSDMHLQSFREKWELKERELLNKQDVYYEDLRFDEARSHGVSYWKFSTDTTKRLEEQEMLRKTRAETEQKQKEAKALRDRREQQRQARLIAARQRQRARLGLPPIDPSEIVKITEQQVTEAEPETEEVKEDLEIRLKKAAHVRPWDVGKDGVQQPVMTQEEWVEKKRDERIDEFAPTYREQPEGGPSFTRKKKRPIIGPTPPEPSTSEFDMSHGDMGSRAGPTDVKRKKLKKKTPIVPSLPAQSAASDLESDFDENPMYSRTKNFLKKRQAAPGSPSGFQGGQRVPQGVEVPPPLDFDHHTPAARFRPAYTASSLKETADAIEAGLRILRHQVESSQATSEDTHTDST